jgi:hypothetical protein
VAGAVDAAAGAVVNGIGGAVTNGIAGAVAGAVNVAGAVVKVREAPAASRTSVTNSARASVVQMRPSCVWVR